MSTLTKLFLAFGIISASITAHAGTSSMRCALKYNADRPVGPVFDLTNPRSIFVPNKPGGGTVIPNTVTIPRNASITIHAVRNTVLGLRGYDFTHTATESIPPAGEITYPRNGNYLRCSAQARW